MRYLGTPQPQGDTVHLHQKPNERPARHDLRKPRLINDPDLNIEDPDLEVAKKANYVGHALNRTGSLKKEALVGGGKLTREAISDTHTRVTIPASEFLFTQASIVASVPTEPNSYLIVPEFSKYVNHNGDTWTNAALEKNYKSFIGSFNYVNHQQDPRKAAGVVVDAVLRKMFHNADENQYNYYCDILIATHRSFDKLVKAIASGDIQYLSMGCQATHGVCSRCGHVSQEEYDHCDHMANQKGRYFFDAGGRRRIVAEELGGNDPDSVTFIEASWLDQPPAFHGAASRNILRVEPTASVAIDLPNYALSREAAQIFLSD